MTTLAAYLASVDIDASPVVGLPSCSTYVGSAVAEATKVRVWYQSAIAWCDAKLSSRDFTAAPPVPCILAVYEYVKAMRDIYGRGAGVSEVATGQRSETYSAGLGHSGIGAGGLGPSAAAGAFAWPLLEPYVEDVSLFASGGVG